MFDTTIRVKGLTRDASNLFHPKTYLGISKYSLELAPLSLHKLAEVEERVYMAKKAFANEHWQEMEDIKASGWEVYQDRIINECMIKFETLYKPRIDPRLKKYEREASIEDQIIQVTGHIKIHKGGNAFLSMHIVEPASPEEGY